MVNNTVELSNLFFSDEFFCDELRRGFFVSETMKRHWASGLKVLSEIDKICRRHDLKWFADSGTLIGVIRHNGFIPWDDDVDIAMLREDFEIFLKYAREELPEGYCIAYESEMETERNPFSDYNDPFCKIVNSREMRIDNTFLEEHFGCPLLTGVDIFIFDKVYNDFEQEQDRVKRANLIYSTYWGIVNKTITEVEVRTLLSIIEKDNNVNIHYENAKRELLHLFIEVSKECKDENAKEVALMYIWVMNGKYKYPRSYYDTWKEEKFENTKLRIPQKYHEILSAYYGNYMIAVKGTSDHQYPEYRDYEEKYRTASGKYPLRYAFERDDFKPLKYRKTMLQKITEMYATINKLHTLIKDNITSMDVGKANAYLRNCQEAAIAIGNIIEIKFGETTEAVFKLEQYCEKVYEASIDWNDKMKQELDAILSDALKETEELFDNSKKEILILLCKATWWGSMREIYLELDGDARNNISIIPIPYYYRNYVKMPGEMKRDMEEIRAIRELEGKVTNFDQYNIEKRHPDAILIQFPYDGSSSAMGIPELLYSDNLKQYTDELIYVPYLNPTPPESEIDVAYKAMIDLVEQPAVFNSDLVIVGSEGLRNYYINTLVKLTDSSLQEYWDKRIVGIDNLMKGENGESR